MNDNLMKTEEEIQEYYAQLAEERILEDRYWEDYYNDLVADEIISESKNL